MENLQLFPIELFKFKNTTHDLQKQQWMEYLNNTTNFSTNKIPGRNLYFTTPNLIREISFYNLIDWAKNCFAKTYESLGFKPFLQFTSVWCTKHLDGGNHARHTHGNTYLAGIYYLSGTVKNSPTVFYNPNSTLYNTIVPPKSLHAKNNHSWCQPFEEGTLLIFPAWLEHSTYINDIKVTDSVRFIMGFNSLPVGKTNQDPYDRYCYYPAKIEDMISSFDDRM